MRATLRGVEVRPLADGDLEAALDLFEAVVAEGRWLATEAPVNRREVRARWRALLATGEGILLVAVDAAGASAGLLALVGREAPELGMAVRADRRRQGVGDALVLAALASARERGARSVVLQVFPHNAAAVALYRKHGFVPRGLVPGGVARRSGERWDALVMERELGGPGPA
jgi:ribosomal protein S18 acetylase RimI-like enzyme